MADFEKLEYCAKVKDKWGDICTALEGVRAWVDGNPCAFSQPMRLVLESAVRIF